MVNHSISNIKIYVISYHNCIIIRLTYRKPNSIWFNVFQNFAQLCIKIRNFITHN